jgi:hypothetical protein
VYLVLPFVEDEVTEQASQDGGGDQEEDEGPQARIEQVELQAHQPPEPQRRPHCSYCCSAATAASAPLAEVSVVRKSESTQSPRPLRARLSERQERERERVRLWRRLEGGLRREGGREVRRGVYWERRQRQ